MAVKASATITLNSVVDIKATYRYYLLQSSTASEPAKPTTNPPGGSWTDAEPTYTSGSTNSLYFVDLTVFSDDAFSYSSVSKSTSYEAAKEAYNKAVTAQNSVNNLKIGGRNLLKNSNHLYECTSASDYGSAGTFYMVDGYDLQSLIGKTLTFSYFVHCPGERNADPDNGLGSRFGMHGTINWTNSDGGTNTTYPFASYLTTSHTSIRVEMSQVVTPPSGYDTIKSISIAYQPHAIPAEGNSETWKIGMPKLEIGTRATDWTPAPEDVDDSIDNANNKADQLIQWKEGAEYDFDLVKGVLMMLAGDTSGDVTQFEQTANGWSFTFANLNDAIMNNKDAIDDNKDGLDDANHNIADLVKFMNLNREYIDFKEVDGEPCIELGVGGSPFKIQITNTRITFMENADVPTYIQDGTLMTEKIQVTQEYAQSGFVWKKRSNGNYGLSWKGV